MWLGISLYQGQLIHARLLTSYNLSHVGVLYNVGSAIMIMSLILFENEFLNIVSISFTALILNELIMVALEITIWYDEFRTLDGGDILTCEGPTGMFTWSSRRSSRFCCTVSASFSYPSTLVCSSVLLSMITASDCEASKTFRLSSQCGLLGRLPSLWPLVLSHYS